MFAKSLIAISAVASLLVPQVAAVPRAAWIRRQEDAQKSFTLDPAVISPGLAQDGQGDNPDPGQVRSLTSTNNFINFCLPFLDQGIPLTDGKQITTGSCNPTPIGRIISLDVAPRCKFVFPKNGDESLEENQPFTVQLKIKNLQTGFFTNAQTNYYAAPQQVNDQGIVKGHSHVVIELLPSIDTTEPLDPTQFKFFKGLNDVAQNDILTASVSSGLAAGAYRMCSINTGANHQPTLVSNAQHGTLDDCVYFTIKKQGEAKASSSSETATATDNVDKNQTTSTSADATSTSAADNNDNKDQSSETNATATDSASETAAPEATATETQENNNDQSSATESSSDAPAETPAPQNGDQQQQPQDQNNNGDNQNGDNNNGDNNNSDNNGQGNGDNQPNNGNNGDQNPVNNDNGSGDGNAADNGNGNGDNNNAPQDNAPSDNAPPADAPPADSPPADAPPADAPPADAPPADSPPADAPPADAPPADAPPADAPPADAPPADAPPADAPPADAPPADTPAR